jgi:hypothetical protein
MTEKTPERPSFKKQNSQYKIAGKIAGAGLHF